MSRSIDLRRLRYFVAVAEELHFTRAAARLHIAQPALSYQIRALEQELGLQLLARTKRSVQLTDAGRVLLEHAYRILTDVDRAQQAAHRAAQGDLGRLVIGLVPPSVSELIFELIGTYHHHHPHVAIVLRELQNHEQVDALIADQIQVGLLTQRIDHQRIRLTALERQQVLVAMPATHRLAKRRSLRLAELANERWVNNPIRTTLLYAACAKAGFEPILSEQASDHTTRLALVAAGIGLTLISETAPRPPSHHIVYRPLDPNLTHNLFAARLKDQPSHLVDDFLDIAQTLTTPTVK